MRSIYFSLLSLAVVLTRKELRMLPSSVQIDKVGMSAATRMRVSQPLSITDEVQQEDLQLAKPLFRFVVEEFPEGEGDEGPSASELVLNKSALPALDPPPALKAKAPLPKPILKGKANGKPVQESEIKQAKKQRGA